MYKPGENYYGIFLQGCADNLFGNSAWKTQGPQFWEITGNLRVELEVGGACDCALGLGD